MTSQKLFCLVAVAALIVPVTSTAQDLTSSVNKINLELSKEGLMIGSVEWITSGDSDKQGRTVYFNDRGNKQLSAHWVAGDSRRGGFEDITYLVDMADGATSSGLSAADTQGAIDSAMSTWNGVNCSAIPVTNLGGVPFDLGYVQYVYGHGGYPGWFADLTHAGWLPGSFFDLVDTDGSQYILGVTFTLVWVDGGRNPTDIDNNGRDDVAFREIYYNDNFPWANDDGHIDVETIALHESGHGLSQGHFGTAFRTKNDKLHFAPRALMNATYSGIQREIKKTDNGGHCSIWGEWPDG